MNVCFLLMGRPPTSGFWSISLLPGTLNIAAEWRSPYFSHTHMDHVRPMTAFRGEHRRARTGGFQKNARTGSDRVWKSRTGWSRG